MHLAQLKELCKDPNAELYTVYIYVYICIYTNIYIYIYM